MSDLVSASDVKNVFMECPICMDHFEESTRIPRRMPCCVQSICQPCLETYSRGRETLSCPLCRHQHHLLGGVRSLPKEPLILKMLDYFKIQQDLALPCTGCPDSQSAVAKCADCGVFLCRECLNAHKRAISLRSHITITFEEMKGRPAESFHCRHQCPKHQQPQEFFCSTCNKVICVSCTVVEHKEGNGHIVLSAEKAHEEKTSSFENAISALESRAWKMTAIVEKTKAEAVNLKAYCETEKDKINETFDSLIQELQVKRASLLSELDDGLHRSLAMLDHVQKSVTDTGFKAKSTVEYTRKMRSNADTIEDLQFIVSALGTLETRTTESLEDAELAFSVMSFVPTNVREMFSVIKETGLIKETSFNMSTDGAGQGKVSQDLYQQGDSKSGVTTSGSVTRLATPDCPTSSSKNISEAIREDKVSVSSCREGDLVLICLSERHNQYVVFTMGTTLHFLTPSCHEALGLNTGPGEAQKTWVLAVITDKEYCQAKKPSNRFKVPVGTKFYLVKAKPWFRQKNISSSSVPVEDATVPQ